MERFQHLSPSPDLLDDGVRVRGPDEGLRVIVGLDEVSIDGGLEIDDALEHACLSRCLVNLAKNPSTALSHEAEVGVK
jgi:hypothetical protein